MPKPAKRQSSTSHLPVVCLGALAFDASSGKPLPTRLKIANWGENLMRGTKVKFFVNEQTAQELPANQSSRGYDDVPGDYEHQSEEGHPNFLPDPREYWSRNGKLEVVPGEGLFLTPEYTPSGLKHAANYQDLSGVFLIDKKTHAVIAVSSVALCKHGQIEGAKFMQAALSIAAAMPDTPMGLILAHAKDLLDLNDEATEEDVAQGLEALVRAKNQPDPVKSKPSSQSKTMDDELKASLAASNKAIELLTKNVETLSASVGAINDSRLTDAHNAAVDAEILAASQAGKKVPDSLRKKDDKGKYLTSSDVVKEVCAALPATVATEFTTPGHVAHAAAPPADGSAVLQVCAALNIKPEALEKEGVLKSAGPQGKLAEKLATAA